MIILVFLGLNRSSVKQSRLVSRFTQIPTVCLLWPLLVDYAEILENIVSPSICMQMMVEISKIRNFHEITSFIILYIKYMATIDQQLHQINSNRYIMNSMWIPKICSTGFILYRLHRLLLGFWWTLSEVLLRLVLFVMFILELQLIC